MATDVRDIAADGVPGRAGVVDFAVEGILRVRTRDAGVRDLAAVARDVGQPADAASQPADAASLSANAASPAANISVRFVDEVPHADALRLDGGTMGYGEDGVYFFPRFGEAPLARVSQGPSWGEASIVCRRGVGRIPFLAAAVDFAALSRRWAPIHGSAWVTSSGVGVLVTGWARSGKTGALLAACEAGATPVGDDRILLSANGSSMVGVGRPIEVKDWHLARLKVPAVGAGPVRRILARASSALDIPFHRVRGALSMELDPERLAGDRGVAREARPNLLVILETHRSSAVVAEPADPRTVATRIAAQSTADLMPALRAQLCFDYAFPGQGWTEVERAPDLALCLLAEATEGIPAYVVRHPYPCSLTKLAEVIASLAGSP